MIKWIFELKIFNSFCFTIQEVNEIQTIKMSKYMLWRRFNINIYLYEKDSQLKNKTYQNSPGKTVNNDLVFGNDKAEIEFYKP